MLGLPCEDQISYAKKYFNLFELSAHELLGAAQNAMMNYFIFIPLGISMPLGCLALSFSAFSKLNTCPPNPF